jgi:glycosyltransferase involved in cell wall biosynthesis
VPVVSTRVGAEGLDLAEGTEILRRDDPAAFADAIVSLLADRAAARRQAEAARARVEARYGWGPIGRSFAAALAAAPPA